MVKQLWRRFLGVSLTLGTALAVHAGPFDQGMQNAQQSTTNVATTVGAVLGVVITLVGGGRVAWKAAHGETFTKELIFAIVGVAIAAVSIAA